MADRQTESFAAWELYAQGVVHLDARTKVGHLLARELLEAATRIDPSFSKALAMLAIAYHRDLLLGFADNRDEATRQLMEAARRAVRAGPRDATAHYVLGLGYIWLGEHDKALAAGRKAIDLNPSEAAGHVTIGMALDVLGEPEQALQHLETGARLNPNDPRNEIFETIVARANFNARRYEEAVRWATSALQIRDDFDEARLILAAALGHMGRAVEVRSTIQLDQLGPPDYAGARVRWSRYKHDMVRQHMKEGLRLAGLSEE